jgi:hypothetical protein
LAEPKPHLGLAKAVTATATATAKKMAVLFYNALRNGMKYKDPAAHDDEERHFSGSRTVRLLLGKALHLALLCSAPSLRGSGRS